MKRKILVADDDTGFVNIISARLEKAGYDVICAFEGVRAVELAHKEKPDMIILDWKMPTGKGDAVLEYLSQKNDTKHIPVIIMTGVDESGIEEKARKLGAKEFLHKPYEPQQLLAVIKKLLEE